MNKVKMAFDFVGKTLLSKLKICISLKNIT